MKINAEVSSDDFRAIAHFDAEPWFRQASNEEILSLGNCGWGDWPSEEIAIFMSYLDKDVAKVLRYKEATYSGFSCSINKKDAIIWLKKNRPSFKIPIPDNWSID